MAQHGRYTVVRKLANGGMAEIFLASQQGHEGFQKPVVLKRILGSISADPQFRNMLIDEAHISMSLTHSNIAQVLDLGLAGGRYFLVLELIDGWDLGHVLHRAKLAGWPLPAPLGLFVVTEVCRALAYAHAKRGIDGSPLGIVHRDVSPNNVLISEHGEVKLTDFGIAKAMNKREHTGTGVVKGKVAFMSPEQGLGKPIDARSDLFSLGTLLYLVTTGTRPFDASTDLETLLRVQRADFKPPARVRPDLAPDVIHILQRAMQLNADDRYQSADDMLVDLERALRADFGGVGQTELKQFLAELHRRDGIPPIARAQPVIGGPDPSSGADLLEGNAVVLADAQDGVADEKTDLAEIINATDGGPPRLARRSAAEFRGPKEDLDPGISLGIDGPGGSSRGSRRSDVSGRETTPPRTARRPVEELSLPEGADDDAPPMRYRRRQRRAFPVVLVVALVVAGAGIVAVRYFSWPPEVAAFVQKNLQKYLPGQAGSPAATEADVPPAAETAKAGEAAPRGQPAAEDQAGSETPGADKGSAAMPPAAAKSPTAEGPSGKSRGETTAPIKPEAVPPVGDAVAKNGDEADKRAASTAATARERKPKGTRENDVFKDSARRVRSLQGLEQFPQGTIQLTNPGEGAPSEGSRPTTPDPAP